MTSLKKIIWLASYPKSGNTWFRVFITALLNNGIVNINDLKTNGIFSSRTIFDNYTDIDSSYLYDDEAKIVLPDIYRELALDKKEQIFIKVHDAFICNQLEDPIIPENVSFCAIYFIRNPLDIAGSLANHLNSSLDKAVNFMCKKDACFSPQKANLNTSKQIRQYLSDWSFHVETWTTIPRFPVHVVRYEDMVTNPFDTFKGILSKIGWLEYNDIQIQLAIDASSFSALQSQEKKIGFIEKPLTSVPLFYRKGKINNWKDELTENQVTTIINTHHKVMKMYDYNQ
ncbi:MAG: sulfotransferase domain-containing protein [Bacteroidetes bacterium]|nr:sulfotransferase domain-containing protein [Bacteroidota bacterium]